MGEDAGIPGVVRDGTGSVATNTTTTLTCVCADWPGDGSWYGPCGDGKSHRPWCPVAKAAGAVMPGGDELTCLSCGTNGIGIGFRHECDPLAAKAERAAVVKWLREGARDKSSLHHEVRLALADRIEKCEHLSWKSAR